MLLPPLHETSFDSQYKTFKAKGGFGKQKNMGAVNDMEFHPDLQGKISHKGQGMPFVRRNFMRPAFAEENYPVQSVF